MKSAQFMKAELKALPVLSTTTLGEGKPCQLMLGDKFHLSDVVFSLDIDIKIDLDAELLTNDNHFSVYSAGVFWAADLFKKVRNAWRLLRQARQRNSQRG